MALAAILAEIQAALGLAQPPTLAQVIAATPQQKRKVWQAMVASRLPLVLNTPKGTATITSASVVGGLLVISGAGVIVDASDGTWVVRVNTPPVFVPDPAGTDYSRSAQAADGSTVVETFRLDPVQAVHDVLANIVALQGQGAP